VDRFPFSTEIEVRFAETDAQGIAHHASFVVWLEVARVEYLARFAGGYQAIRDRGFEALTTEVKVRYHRAASFDDRLTVEARCVDLRGARFRYEYRITLAGELVAEASTSHAVVDAATYRPTRVPDWLADAIATAEAESSRPATGCRPAP
jgi:acyl-CoA thioester hydrolase